MIDLLRRAEDKNIGGQLICGAGALSAAFWNHHIDAFLVLCITMALSVRVVEWALDFGSLSNLDGVQRAAVVAAVLGPWGLMQAAMFKFYVELKGKRNGEGSTARKEP